MDENTSTLSRRPANLRQSIEERIATGVYPPGMRLDEQELASSFGVSRTPIREALIQLGSVGLLEVRPRRGATVPEMSAERLCEMFEVMAGLEAMCGRLAARRIQPLELAALRKAHQACESARAAGDCDLYYEQNEVFHRCLYEAGQNAFLAEQAAALQRRLQPYRRLQLRVRNRMDVSFSEHCGIVAAVEAGNGEQAAELLRAHVVIQGERFSDLVATLRRINPVGGSREALIE
jgi:DNA-binding GntR family transcriptional regulator